MRHRKQKWLPPNNMRRPQIPSQCGWFQKSSTMPLSQCCTTVQLSEFKSRTFCQSGSCYSLWISCPVQDCYLGKMQGLEKAWAKTLLLKPKPHLLLKPHFPGTRKFISGSQISNCLVFLSSESMQPGFQCLGEPVWWYKSGGFTYIPPPPFLWGHSDKEDSSLYFGVGDTVGV